MTFNFMKKVIRQENPKAWQFSRVSVSREFDTDPEQSYPVLLYIPNTDLTDHYHIELSRQEAHELYKWLGEYLIGDTSD